MKKAFSNLRFAIEPSGVRAEDVTSINVYIVDYTEANLASLAAEEAPLFKIGQMPTSTLGPVPRLESNAIAVFDPS